MILNASRERKLPQPSEPIAVPCESSLDEDVDYITAWMSCKSRTESTHGEHALYHRLRTAPLGAHLEAFEALVRRMTVDAGLRERAQMALARLQDPHGYDVWWLARAGAVERRSWYAVFPVLTASAIVLAALAPFWSSAVVPLVAVLVLNVAVRYATDFQIGTIARSFRQCAPLIATAESLRFLGGDDIRPHCQSASDGRPGPRQTEVDFSMGERGPVHVVGQCGPVGSAVE